ncbi:MAG: transketolase [Nitriliruptoraceae bacterium]
MPAGSPAGVDPSTVEGRSINAIRALAMDAVQRANSGHPGMPMGCAPLAYLLYRHFMRHDPADPGWVDRDRFVLSAGHGSMLLYATLHLSGYERPTIDDIKAFRQWGSVTAGHPEHHELPGVETTTGPLGQGFANGVGMALASERLAAEFNRPGHDIVDHRIYAIVSDGDLMEGVASEAASLAGTLRLGRLTYLYDDNRITIDGGTGLAFTEDVVARFDAYGWHTQRVADANDVDALREAIKAADADERPSLIAVRTVIGFGAPTKAGSSAAHGAPLGDDEIAAARRALQWDHPPFEVPDDVVDHMDRRADGALAHGEWRQRFEAYRADHPDLAAEFERRVMSRRLPDDWADALPSINAADATRKHSGTVINAVASVLPELLGGSADLAGSNNTDVEGEGDFSADDRLGRNLRFGVREHAMASIANGMALHGGFIPYVASFLVFTDYLRPALRLSALMRQRVIYVMTHDSIGLGEDGPTHQPVEHLASLRAIPGLTVLRPADGDETVAAWRTAIQHDGPSVIVLTRQSLAALEDKPAGGPERGAYIVADIAANASDSGTEEAAAPAVGQDPTIVLIATGSEVALALESAQRLASEGQTTRVVSMPSWEVFAAQDAAYQTSVLPLAATVRVAVEAAASFGWCRWVGDAGEVVGLDRFGASAPAERLFEGFGFNVDNVVEAAYRSLGRANAD